MSYVVVVLGYSDAGKDTFAEAFSKYSRIVNVKFSAPMKVMLETVYNLPKGVLECKTFRSTLVPGHRDSITWSELMVRCFEYFPKIDSNMMLQNVSTITQEALDNQVPVVFTDVRNSIEVEYIIRLSQRYPLYTIALSRDSASPKVSDKGLKRNLSELILYSTRSYNLYNDGTKQDLQDMACKLWHSINIINSRGN